MIKLYEQTEELANKNKLNTEMQGNTCSQEYYLLLVKQ